MFRRKLWMYILASLIVVGSLAATRWRGGDLAIWRTIRYVDVNSGLIKTDTSMLGFHIASRIEDKYRFGIMSSAPTWKPVSSWSLFNRTSPHYRAHSLETSLDIIAQTLRESRTGSRKDHVLGTAFELAQAGKFDDLLEFALALSAATIDETAPPAPFDRVEGSRE